MAPKNDAWGMRKTVLGVELNRGKTTVAEAGSDYDLLHLEIKGWVEDVKRGKPKLLRERKAVAPTISSGTASGGP